MISRDRLKDLPEEVIEELSSNYAEKQRDSPQYFILKTLKKSQSVMDLDDVLVSMYENFKYTTTRAYVRDALKSLADRGVIGKSQFENVYWYPTVDFTLFLEDVTGARKSKSKKVKDEY